MIQPAFCAHTVVTTGNWPTFVIGFEGKDECEVPQRKQVLNDYSTRLGVERRKMLLKRFSDEQALTSLSTLKTTKTSVLEHWDCFQYEYGKTTDSTLRGVKAPQRKRRMLFFSRVREKNKQKAVEKQATVCI